MEKFTVIALGNLNLREGPGESFEIAEQVPSGYPLTVIDVAKDGGDHRWYKIDNGNWVKAIYVTQPNNTHIKDKRIKSNNDTAMFPTFSVGGGIGGSVVDTAARGLNSLISVAGIAGAAASSLIGNMGAGLSTQQRILSRRIFGVPHQFIDTTDMRPNDGGPLGIEFVTNILAESPILSILPGIPDYLAGKSTAEKENIMNGLISSANEALTQAEKESLKAKDLDMKFFEFEPRCTEYMTYVNVLCRMAATFMGLDSIPVPGYPDKNYGTFNWFRWHLSNAYAGEATTGTIQKSLEDLKKEIGELGEGLNASNITDKLSSIKDKISTGKNFEQVMQNVKGEMFDGQKKVMDDEDTMKTMNGIDNATTKEFYMDSFYIDFFVKPPSYSESFQNSTTSSKFLEGVNAVSGISKELQFLMGGAMNMNLGAYDEQIGDFTKNQNQIINQANLNEHAKKVMSSLITGSTAVVMGANLIFPEIWDSSNYSRDFSLEITLTTPYGNRESIFLNIIVPMMFLIALALPRQVTVNSYSSPFLVRCTVPGFFTCDMGMVKDLAISKGGSDGSQWTKDGLPTEVTITINIGDLYNSLSMSNYRTPRNMWNFIWNTPLVDYVGTVCGLNMKSSEMKKKLMVIWNLVSAFPSDQVDYTTGSLTELMAMARTRVMGAKG